MPKHSKSINQLTFLVTNYITILISCQIIISNKYKNTYINISNELPISLSTPKQILNIHIFRQMWSKVNDYKLTYIQNPSNYTTLRIITSYLKWIISKTQFKGIHLSRFNRICITDRDRSLNLWPELATQ